MGHEHPLSLSPYSHHPKGMKAYFYSGFVAYILGLGTTIAVMHIFKAAQPALLYLVPTCLGLPLLLALLRGDIPDLIKFVYASSPSLHSSYRCLPVALPSPGIEITLRQRRETLTVTRRPRRSRR